MFRVRSDLSEAEEALAQVRRNLPPSVPLNKTNTPY